jgi:hypothetical protein
MEETLRELKRAPRRIGEGEAEVEEMRSKVEEGGTRSCSSRSCRACWER